MSAWFTPQYNITNPELTIFGKQYDVIEFPCLLIFFRIPNTLIQVSEKHIWAIKFFLLSNS